MPNFDALRRGWTQSVRVWHSHAERGNEGADNSLFQRSPVFLQHRREIRFDLYDVMYCCQSKYRKSRFFFESFFCAQSTSLGWFSTVEGNDKTERITTHFTEFCDRFELCPAGCDNIVNDHGFITFTKLAQKC